MATAPESGPLPADPRAPASLPSENRLSRAAIIRRSLLLFAGFLALTVLATWPLATRLTTHLPMTHFVGYTDAIVAGWSLAWASHALVTAPLSIADGNIFHPTPNALFYGPAGFGALPLFAPVFLASGNAVLALNATLLLGIALTAWTMSLVVLRWTDSLGAALLSGCAVLMSHWLVRGMVPTVAYSAALFYFPVIAYLAAKRTEDWRALWLAPLVALQASVCMVYVAPAVFAPLGSIAAFRMLRADTRAAGTRLAIALGLALLLIAPLVMGYVGVRAANPQLHQQTFQYVGVEFPLPLPHGVFSQGHSARGTPSLILALISVGALLRWRERTARPPHERGIWVHGLLWVAVGTVISLFPRLSFAGMTMPSPMWALQAWIPEIGVIRTPDRLGVATLIGMGLLTGAATAEIARALASWLARFGSTARSPALGRFSPGLVGGAALAAFSIALWLSSAHARPLAGEWQRPLQLWQPPRWSAGALAVLRAGRGPMVELPVPEGKPNPFSHARAMFRSTDHFRPLLNGHHSYYPTEHEKRMKLAARLPAPDAVEALRASTGLTLIAVHLEDLLPRWRRRWERFASAPNPGFRLVYRSREELLFVLKPR